LFLTLFLLLVEEDRKGFTIPLFLWLPLYVIWLNVHGGFLVGFGLFVLYIVERVFFGLFDHTSFRELLAVNKRLLATLVLMCLLLPVNPYGLDYVPYLWNAISCYAARRIQQDTVHAIAKPACPVLLYGIVLCHFASHWVTRYFSYRIVLWPRLVNLLFPQFRRQASSESRNKYG
jgi:hypothetical protein